MSSIPAEKAIGWPSFFASHEGRHEGTEGTEGTEDAKSGLLLLWKFPCRH